MFILITNILVESPYSFQGSASLWHRKRIRLDHKFHVILTLKFILESIKFKSNYKQQTMLSQSFDQPVVERWRRKGKCGKWFYYTPNWFSLNVQFRSSLKGKIPNTGSLPAKQVCPNSNSSRLFQFGNKTTLAIWSLAVKSKDYSCFGTASEDHVNVERVKAGEKSYQRK